MVYENMEKGDQIFALLQTLAAEFVAVDVHKPGWVSVYDTEAGNEEFQAKVKINEEAEHLFAVTIEELRTLLGEADLGNPPEERIRRLLGTLSFSFNVVMLNVMKWLSNREPDEEIQTDIEEVKISGRVFRIAMDELSTLLFGKSLVRVSFNG